MPDHNLQLSPARKRALLLPQHTSQPSQQPGAPAVMNYNETNTTSYAKTSKTSASRGKRTAIAASNATTGRGATGGVAAAPVADPMDGSLATAAATERLCTPPKKTLPPSSAPPFPTGSWRSLLKKTPPSRRVARRRVAEFRRGGDTKTLGSSSGRERIVLKISHRSQPQLRRRHHDQ